MSENNDAEQLTTMLILKHGSIETMYDLWLHNKIEVTKPEMDVMTATLKSNIDAIYESKAVCATLEENSPYKWIEMNFIFEDKD